MNRNVASNFHTAVPVDGTAARALLSPATVHPKSLLDLPSGEARESLLAVHGILRAVLPPGILRSMKPAADRPASCRSSVLDRAHVTVVDIDEDQIRNNTMRRKPSSATSRAIASSPKPSIS